MVYRRLQCLGKSILIIFPETFWVLLHSLSRNYVHNYFYFFHQCFIKFDTTNSLNQHNKNKTILRYKEMIKLRLNSN